MIDLPQDGSSGRLDADTARRQGAQELRRRVRVDRPDRSERGGDLGCQLAEPGRPQLLTGCRGRARAQRLGEQPVMHVGAPGQAGMRHLGRDQRSRRLGRSQQGKSRRVGVSADPAKLTRMHVDQSRQLHARIGCGVLSRIEWQLSGRWAVGRPRLSPAAGHFARRAAARRATARRATARRATARRAAARQAVACRAIARRQQCSGEIDVVTAGDPYPGPQQAGVDELS